MDSVLGIQYEGGGEWHCGCARNCAADAEDFGTKNSGSN